MVIGCGISIAKCHEVCYQMAASLSDGNPGIPQPVVKEVLDSSQVVWKAGRCLLLGGRGAQVASEMQHRHGEDCCIGGKCEQLTGTTLSFPSSFPIDFAFGKPAGKLAIKLYMTVRRYNWRKHKLVTKCPDHNHVIVGVLGWPKLRELILCAPGFSTIIPLKSC